MIESPPRVGQDAPRTPRGWLREALIIGVVSLLLFFVVRSVAQVYPIDGPSMQPGLHNGERVTVSAAAYSFASPARGDVVVLHPPGQANSVFIKRIIGVPGDTVVVQGFQVTLNGVVLKEPYVAAVPQYFDAANAMEAVNITLAPGEYFVMGDNRANSDDSRSFGPVPRANIIGKAQLIAWPLNNVQGISTYPQVFAAAAAAKK